MVEALGKEEVKTPKSKVVRNIEAALRTMGYDVNRDHMGYHEGRPVTSLGGEDLAFRVKPPITAADTKEAGIDRQKIKDGILDGTIDLGKKAKPFTEEEKTLIRTEKKDITGADEEAKKAALKTREAAMRRLNRYVAKEVDRMIAKEPEKFSAIRENKMAELKNKLTEMGFELGEPRASGTAKIKGEEKALPVGLHGHEVKSGWAPLVITSKGQALGEAVDKLVAHARTEHSAQRHDGHVKHHGHAHNPITGNQLVSDERLGGLQAQKDKSTDAQIAALEREIAGKSRRLAALRERRTGAEASAGVAA